MVKFSVCRQDDDAVDDDDFSMPCPKRRRPTTSDCNSHTSAANNDHQKEKQINEETDDSTATTYKSGQPVTVILSDPDVLDCSLCFEPLTIPVFQCDNGHIACSSCCGNLGNKCPSCCGKIGNNRCRAIEKVIESVRVSCCYLRYGCKETVSYCMKHEHEEKCNFAPCSCPFPNCLFRGSSRKLSRHMSGVHSDAVVRFRFNSTFSVSVGMDENFVVLQEERYNIIYILTHGNSVAVRCIDPKLSEGFVYDLLLHGEGSSLKFQSVTRCITGQLSDPPSMDYVLVPGYFYSTGGCLKLELCIWSKDASHAERRG